MGPNPPAARYAQPSSSQPQDDEQRGLDGEEQRMESMPL